MGRFSIGKRVIDFNGSPYFIADVGANHDGEKNRAFDLIHLAKESGADAVKFQNFQAPKIVSKVGFENLRGNLTHQSKWKKSIYEVYEDASLNPDWTAELKEHAQRVGIDYFTSPYDLESVDRVDPFVDVYKIGSGDITWPLIIEHIAKKKKPILIATGASSLGDVQRAMEILLSYTKDICLMQCNTNYSGGQENFKYINLNVLKTFKELYPDIILGLSDHTSGHATVLGALALGARVIEKHFTDDNRREGPDHPFAMNPKTWREMVDRSHELFLALGDGHKRIEENEMQTAVVQRRALRVRKGLEKNSLITMDDLESLRPIPENGIAPYQIKEVVGKKLAKEISAGDHLTWEHLLQSN